VQESAMAKAISGHSAPKSGMAIAAIPVAPPLIPDVYIIELRCSPNSYRTWTSPHCTGA